MKASAKMMQLTIYEAAKIQLAGLAWWQAKKHTCFKHCPAAKAYVWSPALDARSRGNRSAGR